MDQNLDREKAIRKKYIEFFAEKLYTRFNYLFEESLVEVKEKAVSMFLDTDLSYDDITNEMIKIIEKRKEEYERRKEEEAKMKAEGMPTTAAVVEKPVERDNIPVTAATPQPELDVMPTIAVGEQPIIDTIPTTAVDVQPEKDNIPNVAHINSFDQVRMVDDYSAGAISKAPARSFDKPVPNINELNNMLEEKPKEEKTENTNDLENSNQYVKTNSNNSSDGQSGSISLFNIILSILAIAAFVLVAMILNVLLK